MSEKESSLIKKVILQGMLSTEVMNKLENITEQKQKFGGKNALEEIQKLHQILENLKRYEATVI